MQLFSNVDIDALLTTGNILGIVKILVILLVGYLLIRIIAFAVRRALKRRVSEQARMIVNKAVIYTGVVILSVIVLAEMGMELTPLLGAAGIVGLAVGIASQTSLSNVIAGVFLVSEKPFAVGDVIRVGDKTGVVQSIDLLSIKIRTFDNLYIRIPNDRILNSDLVNITKYPIRRLDLNVSVAYKEDLERVRDLLLSIAKENIKVLNEPPPLVLFKEFGESGIELLFAVWFVKTDFLEVKNAIFMEVKRRFDQEGIEIPFPHVTIYAGSATGPIPVELSGSTESNRETKKPAH